MNDPKYKNIDLVEQFYKENVDLKAIQKARAAKKTVTSGLEPYTGEFGKAQKKHLLNRTMMGYAHRHYKDIENLTLDQAIDLIFTPEGKPDPPVNDYYHEITREEVESRAYTYVPPGEPFDKAPDKNPSLIYRHQSFYAWIFKNNINQSTSIHWKMVFFLHNLLSCSNAAVKKEIKHMDLLFNSVYTSYKETIRNLTLDPMMMDFLGLQLSKKENPDENYARELQELFTVGKGPNSNYTEQDIIEIAKALTGWIYSDSSFRTQGPIISSFKSENHDPSNKYFSPFYDNQVIEGKSDFTGSQELDHMLNMIFETKECGLYLCRRLYQFFVYPYIDENIEINIIKPLADILREKNYKLIEALKVLLKSEHFFDASFYNALIKAPTEYLFGIMKEFDFEYKNFEFTEDIPSKYTNKNTADFYKFRPLDWAMNNLGLRYMFPPSVSGWPAYYQPPVFDLFWINSATITERSKLGDSLGRWGIILGPGDSGGWVQLAIDRVAYVTSFPNPIDIDSIMDQVSNRLLAAPMNEITKTRIKNAILEGQSDEHYAELVNTYLADPNEENKAILSNRLEHLFIAIFQLGEFQLF